MAFSTDERAALRERTEMRVGDKCDAYDFRRSAPSDLPPMQEQDTGTIRAFATGATRDTAQGKPDFEGFLSPLVLEAYGAYMHVNRLQADGTLRDSDNWQKGIPLAVYVKSGWRHFFDWWKGHRGHHDDTNTVVAALGLLFNTAGYLHERLKADPTLLQRLVPAAEIARDKGRAK